MTACLGMHPLRFARGTAAAGRGRRLRLLAASCACSLACACATYVPRPLDPDASAHAYAGRRLDDPELVAFVRAQAEAPREFPPARWSLHDLTLVAWWASGDMHVARAHRDAVRSALAEQRSPPNPVLSADLERVTNGSPRPWALGFTFDLPLDPSGKRAARTAVAERDVDVAELAVCEAAWHVRSDVRRALMRRTFTDRGLALARERVEVRRQALAGLDRALAAGAESSAAVARARASLAQAESELAVSESVRRNADAELALALGVAEAALDPVVFAAPESTELPAAPPLEAAQAAGLANRLDLRMALVAYARAEAAVRLEVANQYPDLHLLPGHQWDQGAHKIRFGFALPLPVFDDHRPAIERAEAEREEARARFVAVQERALGAIAAAHVAYGAALAEYSAMRGLRAANERLAHAATAAFDAGSLARPELLETRLGLLEIERAELDARERAETALGTLEDSMQRPLSGVDMPASPEVQS